MVGNIEPLLRGSCNAGIAGYIRVLKNYCTMPHSRSSRLITILSTIRYSSTALSTSSKAVHVPRKCYEPVSTLASEDTQSPTCATHMQPA